ncbi:hypothetical protein LTR70_001640 [Exophiala xenobiotica]|uniref:Uncharacterized protein n=1 Tax=Lithohypha guttulata TaxID=1690604 RepID=A0ABR0KHD9_9EURO|nr:hypothetical protein LTR24_002531 [Lithohypha guttulata]KAK5327166.1 hypothetical protein LTR70_001640 [Exophiala xenobiotica]
MPSAILRLLRRKLYKPVKRTLRRLAHSSQHANTPRNAEFHGIKSAEYSQGVFAVHRNRVTAEAVRELGPVGGIDERKVVGRGWRVVDGGKGEVLVFGDGRWDCSQNWRRVGGLRGKEVGGRNGTGDGGVGKGDGVGVGAGVEVPVYVAGQTAVSVEADGGWGSATRGGGDEDRGKAREIGEDEDVAEPAMLEHQGIVHGSHLGDQSPAQALQGELREAYNRLESPKAESSTPARIHGDGDVSSDDHSEGGVWLAAPSEGRSSEIERASPILRGGSGRRGANSGVIREVLDAFDRVRAAKSRKGEISTTEPVVQEQCKSSDAGTSKRPQRADQLLSIQETRSIATYEEAWPTPEEAARPDDGVYVDGDDFEVVAKPTAEDAPWVEKSRKLWEQESLRLGVNAYETGERLVVLRAVRERISNDRSEAVMSPRIRAAILTMVENKIEAGKAKADTKEEDWDLVKDNDARAVAALSGNNLRRLWTVEHGTPQGNMSER